MLKRESLEKVTRETYNFYTFYTLPRP